MQRDHDLTSVDIGCDGSTGDNQQKVSKYTDFPASIELLKNANDWDATETFPCWKEQKYVNPGDNFEFQMAAFERTNSCRNRCAEQTESICLQIERKSYIVVTEFCNTESVQSIKKIKS